MADNRGGDDKSGDLPGLSSVFTTTQAGLPSLRRKRRARDDDAPAAAPAADATAGEEPAPPAPQTPLDPAALDPPAAEGAPAPPDQPAADTHTTSVPEAGLELRGGLSLVETAELPALKPPDEDEPALAQQTPRPAAPTDLTQPAAAPATTPPAQPSAGAPAAQQAAAPTPRQVTQPARRPSLPPPSLIDVEPVSARRPSTGSSSNWLLYTVVIIVAVALVAWLVYTVLEL